MNLKYSTLAPHPPRPYTYYLDPAQLDSIVTFLILSLCLSRWRFGFALLVHRELHQFQGFHRFTGPQRSQIGSLTDFQAAPRAQHLSGLSHVFLHLPGTTGPFSCPYILQLLLHPFSCALIMLSSLLGPSGLSSFHFRHSFLVDHRDGLQRTFGSLIGYLPAHQCTLRWYSLSV